MAKLWSTFVPLRWTQHKWSGALAFLSVSLAISYKLWRPPAKKQEAAMPHLLQQNIRDVVIINTVPTRGIYSPFALKIQTFLRMNRIKYAVTSPGNDGVLCGSQQDFSPWIAYNGQIYRDVNVAIQSDRFFDDCSNVSFFKYVASGGQLAL